MAHHVKLNRHNTHHVRAAHTKSGAVLRPGGELIAATPRAANASSRPTSAACYVSDNYRDALFFREVDKRSNPNAAQLDALRTTLYARIDKTLSNTARDLAAAWSTNSNFFLPSSFIKNLDARLKVKMGADIATQVNRSLTKIEGMTFKAGRGEVTAPLAQIHNILGAALLTGQLTPEEVFTLKGIFVANTSRKDTVDAANALMINKGVPIVWKYADFEGVCIGQ